MSQNAQEYWKEVRSEFHKLVAHVNALGPESLQPRPGAVVVMDPPPRGRQGNLTTSGTDMIYMVSRRNRDRGTQAGVITECFYWSAAKFIVDSTHEIASNDEIAAYLKLHEARRAAMGVTALKSLDEQKRGLKPAMPEGV